MTITLDLGRLMLRPEIDEIVSRYGSTVNRDGLGYAEIIPPIPKDKLRELGQALVDFTQTLDNTPPLPTFKIR